MILDFLKKVFGSDPVARLVQNEETRKVFLSSLRSLEISVKSLPDWLPNVSTKRLGQLADTAEKIVQAKTSGDIGLEISYRNSLRNELKEIISWAQLSNSQSVKEDPAER